MDRKARPELRSYLDVRQFLTDYYEQEKTLNKSFSYEAWSRQLGLKSKSTLRFALLGERSISEELTQKFCDYFDFSDGEKEYFTFLVLYTQCENPEQKKFYGQKLTAFLRQEINTHVASPSMKFLADPIQLVLRNLLSFDDLVKTPENLAPILGKSPQEIEDLLSNLEKEGLAIQDSGRWKAAHKNIRFANQEHETALAEYHRMSLLKAIEMQKSALKERSYRSLNLALSPEEYESYQRDLNEFVKMLFAKYNTDLLADRRIYQMNFNLFPWTNVYKM